MRHWFRYFEKDAVLFLAMQMLPLKHYDSRCWFLVVTRYSINFRVPDPSWKNFSGGPDI